MGQGNRRRRSRKQAAKDCALIRDCVLYAQAVAALKAGYEADPDTDGRYAGALGMRHLRRAERALERIAGREACTSSGLEAKARILPVIVSRRMGLLSDLEATLIARFADEVRGDLCLRRAGGSRL
ncbi:hypothetical protein J5J86_00740 [Aquabacter sp. L1I39]|uniref:hypothetical protein n=1 Tax=Aquabacter sp. L1I39 TaxID=2820278 RepID=UPI001ADAEB51|nr:hypothetical protein [Aquabacter sp. L1I39]QTL03938.1 hypothetical protein J5J86_00740 [Aquabacter sp. L1I39]